MIITIPKINNEFNFHDSVLKKIVIDWKLKECNIEISIWNGILNKTEIVVLRIECFKSISIPRYNDWGESESIMEINISDIELNIEMQSGDTIVIK